MSDEKSASTRQLDELMETLRSTFEEDETEDGSLPERDETPDQVSDPDTILARYDSVRDLAD